MFTCTPPAHLIRCIGSTFFILALTACSLLDIFSEENPEHQPVTFEEQTSEMVLPTAHTGESIWIPALVTSWQWDLSSETIDTSLQVDMYDLDLFDTDISSVEKLHAQGSRVVCYINVGAWEDWRPDKDQFPDDVLGKNYAGWPGEKWLDIRQIDELAPIMRARFDECQAKGFDGVEPDNIDNYTNDTGFPLTYQDQLEYNIWLTNEAHARGLSIGLKNDPEQAQDLLPYFDWALTEDCFDQGWCDELSLFVETGKAVFAAEYTDMDIQLDDICPEAEQLNFNLILKNRDLDSYLETCP
ncbi:MAG: endo alpha-1,4 polygalactosaminidase [Anaerolineaceae bacterium]|nr:endo alpha-1,4 polygalactosaminidase [Anaerolineaceae bacterium]